jgi:hypothetical protein
MVSGLATALKADSSERQADHASPCGSAGKLAQAARGLAVDHHSANGPNATPAAITANPANHPRAESAPDDRS